MQMVIKGFIILIAVWLAIVVLMPKQEIYYKLEEELAKQDIILNEAKISEGLFSLTLTEASMYYKGINVATIDEVSFCTLLFYSSMELQSLHMDDSLKAMIPQITKEAHLSHSILSPLDVMVEASGPFGSMKGKIDLSERKVHLDFNESKNIEMLKPQLKKDEKGWFYETSF
jgi:hypothetical protein